MDLKIIYFIEYNILSNAEFTVYISNIKVIDNKVVSYNLSLNSPYIFNDESLLEQTLLLLRTELINNTNYFKGRLLNPKYNYKLEDIKSVLLLVYTMTVRIILFLYLIYIIGFIIKIYYLNVLNILQ